MKKHTLNQTLFLLCLYPLSQAAMAEKAPSVMFAPPEESITSTPPLEMESGGDRCEELLRRIEELKGKPQRKHAAMERYQAECVRDKD